jgi:hypothetical protein
VTPQEIEDATVEWRMKYSGMDDGTDARHTAYFGAPELRTVGIEREIGKPPYDSLRGDALIAFCRGYMLCLPDEWTAAGPGDPWWEAGKRTRERLATVVLA